MLSRFRPRASSPTLHHLHYVAVLVKLEPGFTYRSCGVNGLELAECLTPSHCGHYWAIACLVYLVFSLISAEFTSYMSISLTCISLFISVLFSSLAFKFDEANLSAPTATNCHLRTMTPITSPRLSTASSAVLNYANPPIRPHWVLFLLIAITAAVTLAASVFMMWYLWACYCAQRTANEWPMNSVLGHRSAQSRAPSGLPDSVCTKYPHNWRLSSLWYH